MGIIDTIRRIFDRKPATVTTVDETAAILTAKTKTVSLGLAADTERRTVVTTCRKMYQGDPRARGVIRTVARDIVRHGCKVSVKNDSQAEQIANDLIGRLSLEQKLDDYVRLTLRDGDSFLQLGINAQREIVKLARMSTLEMHRNSNSLDEFDDPRKAFWFSPEIWGGDEPTAEALWFAEWQIVHARHDHDDGRRYGSPLFESAISAWKRIGEGETDIAVRRKTRAGMKYLHVLDGATPEEIEAYKLDNQDALDNPFAAVADFFSNRQGSITTIQGDANLEQINDVLHHIRTWWVASPVPMSLLGYGQDLNRDVLEEQARQYRQSLDQLTEWVEADFVQPLIERQWLLAGILPDSLDYEIVWQTKQEVSAADIRDAADAAMRLKALGMTDAAVQRVLARFLPDMGDDDFEGSESERIAGVADQMGAL